MKNFICLWVVFYWLSSAAQISTTPSSHASTLAQTLAGSGVTISNAVLQAASNSSGLFSANSNTGLGIASGVILTTGRLSDVSKAANAGTSNIGASFDNGRPGDPQLNALSGYPTYNASALTFDVVPTGDKITFRYVFMSEEYPDFVCANYNDVFGFFVSGPKPTHMGGGNYANYNVALVPNTLQPVGINTVNSGVPGPYSTPSGCQGFNTAYYRNNAGNAHIVYNGGTVVLTATIHVIPCSTYTFKLAIADGYDEFYDSGVFIEAGSFTSNRASLSVSYSHIGYLSTYEGCSGATVHFNFHEPYTGYNAFKFQISGTATNGVDYPFIPDSLVVAPGSTTASVSIFPFADLLAEGSETVTISLLDACTQQPYTQVSVLINDTQNVSVIASKTQLCHQESVVLMASGAVSYQWSPPLGLSSTNTAQTTANPASDQTYVVTGTTGNCISSASIFIQRSNLWVSGNVDSSTCGQQGVSITLQVADGKPPYTFSWSDGSTLQNRTGLPSGTYSVTVTDAFQCTKSQSFTVQQSPGITVSGTKHDATCPSSANGSISLQVSGGLPPYTFLWNDGNSTSHRSNLAAGNYSVVVTDANQCTGSASFSVQSQSNIHILPSVTNASCGNANGEVSLQVSGGIGNYSFVWSNGMQTQNISGLSGGNYQVTVTDALGCTDLASVAVASSAFFQVMISKTDVACKGESTGSATATVAGNGNYNFLWSNGATTASIHQLSAGIYTVTISDNQCSTVEDVLISEPSAALSAGFVKTDVTCGNAYSGSAQIIVSGGTMPYQYAWNLPHITGSSASNLEAGNYEITITDAHNCTSFVTFIIEEQEGVTLSVTATPVSCYGGSDGSAGVTVTGGDGNYSYRWNNAAQTSFLPQIAAGVYFVTVTDGSGCSDTASVLVREPFPINITAIHTNVTCTSLGTIDLNISGGTGSYQIAWNDHYSTEDRAGLSAGTYSVTVTDAIQCSVSKSIYIAHTTTDIVIHKIVTQPKCFGDFGNVQLNVSPPDSSYQFIWSDGVVAKDRYSLAPGYYSVTVSDTHGCFAIDSLYINEPAPIATNIQVVPVSCEGNDGAITLQVSGGKSPYHFLWSDSSTLQNRHPLNAGIYRVTVFDANGCAAIDTAKVENTEKLSVNAHIQYPSCYKKDDAAITLAVTGGDGNYFFSWSGNVSSTSSATQLFAGTYYVTISDGKGCTTVQSFFISQPDSLQLTISTTPNLCYGVSDASAQLQATGGTPPFQYSIQLLSTSTAINRLSGNFTEISAGSYTANVKDAHGCQVSVPFVIASEPSDSIIFETFPTSCFNDFANDGSVKVLSLNAANSPYEFSINGNVFTHDVTFGGLTAGSHLITSKNKNGCLVNHQVFIEKGDEFFVSFPSDTLYVEAGHASLLPLEVQNIEDPIVEWSYAIQPAYLDFSCEHCSVHAPICTTPFTNEYQVKVFRRNNPACFKTAQVVVKVSDGSAMPNVFSPNGDNMNDRFYPIFNNTDIVVTEFKIYNPWGQLVHDHALEGWDGNLGGQPQPIGTYTYFLNYFLKKNQGSEKMMIHKNGSFVLVR